MADEPSEALPITRLTLTTADYVALVAEQIVPPEPRAVASLAHPHPQYGGTMHDAVVTTLWAVLAARRVATVRFAFRGGGGSGGRHDGGAAERGDVRAAMDAAVAINPRLPLLACGYSFGAEVTLAVAHHALAAWMVVAPPLRLFDDDVYLARHDTRPKHLFVAAHDPYAPPEVVRERTAHWTATTVHVIDMADHFFRGSLDRLADAFATALDELVGIGGTRQSI